MFGKKRTKNKTNESNTGNKHNLSAQNSDMTSGGRSTKSCSSKAYSNANTSSCGNRTNSTKNSKSNSTKACN